MPHGDHEYFPSQDFQSGILAFFQDAEWWELSVFGQGLLGAFATEPPRAFSHVKERSPGVTM